MHAILLAAAFAVLAAAVLVIPQKNAGDQA